MSIVLQGSTSGSITLQEPAVAGSNTINLPARTGTMSLDGPAFSAYASVAQTVTTNTFNKVTFGIEEFDTNSNFASSTFTPTVAGYYQVNFTLNATATTSLTRIIGLIYKNGNALGRDVDLTISAGTSPTNITGAKLIYMNGTTDYLEIYGFVTGTGTLTLSGNTSNTSYFSACLVRGA